jgi:hypothetical protein
MFNKYLRYQLLVGSVVIDAELDRENYGSIPAIRRGLKLLDARTDSRTRLH